ncbi:hypothetical protein SCOCK_410035 [Actinacidiphila cocklensis]|uniref:Uncharacterized protein n=1 Tax=Actinacidiphila cocklensis TaxID=887465 RepID=A0A9W4GTN2_9ACTN|nr:hypothetical protein SCOCK_410035 [Actinacidiphila cocklensis]
MPRRSTGQHGQRADRQDQVLRQAGLEVPGVHRPHRDHEDGRGDRDATGRGARRQVGVVGDLLHHHLDARADRGGRAQHGVVAVTPHERLPVGGQVLVDGYGEVVPVGREDDQQPAGRDRQQQVEGGGLVERGLHRDRGRRDRLAQHDEREQAVPLGDVVRMPGGAPHVFRVGRHRELRHDQQQEAADPQGAGQQDQAHPAELHHDQARRVAQRDRPLRPGLAGRRPQPLEGQRQPHDEVADDGDGVVGVVEGPRHTGGEHQDAGHLHQRDDPVEDVVGVVRGREPGEVHPGPPDGEEDQQVAADPVPGVSPGERVHQPRARLRDRHHEAQVEQQLKRCRGAVRLGPAARPYPHPRDNRPAVARSRGGRLVHLRAALLHRSAVGRDSRRPGRSRGTVARSDLCIKVRVAV